MSNKDLQSMDTLATELKRKCLSTRCTQCDFGTLQTCELSRPPYKWGSVAPQTKSNRNNPEAFFAVEATSANEAFIDAINVIVEHCEQQNLDCENEYGACEWKPFCSKYWLNSSPDRWVLPDIKRAQDTEGEPDV